jgi:hypothetical protein
MVTAAAIVTDEMLAWATHSPPGEPKRLNIVALIEMTLEYFRLLEQVLLRTTKALYTHAITTVGFADDPGVILSPNIRRLMFMDGSRASEDRRREFPDSINPEYNAYEALWRLFANFRLGPDVVPFSSNGKIDIDEFLNWLRTSPS